jgi:hypothetical protein
MTSLELTLMIASMIFGRGARGEKPNTVCIPEPLCPTGFFCKRCVTLPGFIRQVRKIDGDNYCTVEVMDQPRPIKMNCPIVKIKEAKIK